MKTNSYKHKQYMANYTRVHAAVQHYEYSILLFYEAMCEWNYYYFITLHRVQVHIHNIYNKDGKTFNCFAICFVQNN